MFKKNNNSFSKRPFGYQAFEILQQEKKNLRPLWPSKTKNLAFSGTAK